MRVETDLVIQAYFSGESWAETPFWRIVHKYVRKVVSRMTTTAQVDRDSVVQDSLVEILGWVNRMDNRTPRSLFSFARVTSARNFLNEVRRMRTQTRDCGLEVELDPGIPSKRRSPEEIAIHREEIQKVWRVLKRQTRENRRCMMMMLKGHSFAGIQQRLGLGPNAVGGRIKRLREALRGQ